MARGKYDVVIIGSGPNGLSAGIYLSKKGFKVLIIEAADQVGGGTRTANLTLDGFHHDVCSAVHPMGYASPYLKTLGLENYGLEWVFPEASVAHPLDGQEAVILSKSFEETVENLGVDGKSYRRIIEPLSRKFDWLLEDVLRPLGIPKHPVFLARFGLKAMLPASLFSKWFFRGERAKALFAGCAAHSTLPLNKFFTTAMGLLFLASGHAMDWPMAKGGSQNIANAMLKCFQVNGGVIQLSTRINHFKDLPEARSYVFDTDPFQLADIATQELPNRYLKRLQKFNFGPGVFKIDYALSEPIPWKDKRILKASTVHIGNTFNDIATSEKEVWENIHSEKPFVLLSQQSQFDNKRAPEGKHTCWAYCHVPNGSRKDMSASIENQIERYAPGFKDIILARSSMNTKAFQQYNPNYFGGAISGGATDITQLFTRPVARFDPYSTPNNKIFICSASTPPGGGVHGMCGYYAAKSVERRIV